MTDNEINDIRVMIERDIKWRQDEISFLSNLINNIEGSNKDDLKKIYRKTLVITLYAHFEGYFKYAFEVYAETLNSLDIEIEKVISVLKISSLNNVFSKYDEQNKWIQGTFLYEKNNKRFINRKILIESIDSLNNNKLRLPISSSSDNKNSIVFTESNLTPNVIDKILYRLGIHPKLGVRNSDFNKLMGVVSL